LEDFESQRRRRQEERLASSASTSTALSADTGCLPESGGSCGSRSRFLEKAAGAPLPFQQVKKTRGSWADAVDNFGSDDEDLWEITSSPCEGSGGSSTDLAEETSSLRSVDTGSCGRSSSRSFAAAETPGSVAASSCGQGSSLVGLNPAAPDFIPTMSMVCPLVGVYCHSVPEDEAASEDWPTLSSAASHKASAAGSTSAPSAPRFAGFAGVREVGLTSRFAALAASPDTPGMSALPVRRELFSTSSPSSATVSKSASLLSRDAIEAAEEDGDVSEETWQRREAVRRRAVDLAKATTEYRWYREQKRQDDEPSTPDWRDRSISKRQWKWRVSQWRTSFSQRYLEERACGTSAVSTEEWQSNVSTSADHPTSEAGCGEASSCGRDADDNTSISGYSSKASSP